MAGYTRQSAATIIAGANVTAAIFNAEFNQLQSAFNGTTGHGHTGGTGDGPQLSLTAAVTGVLPIANGGTAGATAAAARTALGLAIGTDVQAWDADLDAISALATTGIAVRTAANTWTTRTLTAPAAGFTITNPAGVAGDPTFVLSDDLAGLEGLSTTGLVTRTASNTYTTRTLTGPAAGISISNGDGVSGNPTLSLANDLSALEGLASTGIAVRTTTDTWAQRTLQAPAAGFTITNPAGVAGDPTFALANDLAALEGLGSTGFAARTGTDTWAQRSLTSSANNLSITNPAGVAGDPVLDLAVGQILTGTWTPTITGVANVAASTSATGYYVRIGDLVHCFVAPQIDPTAATTSTTFRLSLPIASNFTDTTQAAGGGVSSTAVEPLQILSTAATDDITVTFVNGASVANRQLNIYFMYVIL